MEHVAPLPNSEPQLPDKDGFKARLDSHIPKDLTESRITFDDILFDKEMNQTHVSESPLSPNMIIGSGNNSQPKLEKMGENIDNKIDSNFLDLIRGHLTKLPDTESKVHSEGPAKYENTLSTHLGRLESSQVNDALQSKISNLSQEIEQNHRTISAPTNSTPSKLDPEIQTTNKSVSEGAPTPERHRKIIVTESRLKVPDTRTAQAIRPSVSTVQPISSRSWTPSTLGNQQISDDVSLTNIEPHKGKAINGLPAPQATVRPMEQTVSQKHNSKQIFQKTNVSLETGRGGLQNNDAGKAPPATPHTAPPSKVSATPPLPALTHDIKNKELLEFTASTDLTTKQSTQVEHAKAQAQLPTAQHDPRHIAQQLAASFSRQQDGTTVLRLNPEELGQVRMTLKNVDGIMTMTIMAERPETTDTMRRNINELAQEFEALGYEGLDFAFSDDSASHQQETKKDDIKLSGDPLQVNQPAPEAATKTATPPGRLDIRL